MKRKPLLFLLLMALFAPLATMGQNTLTVCDGTATSSKIPLDGYNADASQHNQMLYLADSLTAMSGKEITQLVFYFNSSYGNYSSQVENDGRLGNWTISLGETTATTLSSLDNSTTLTQVYYGRMTWSHANLTLTITFDNGYVYNGGNLLVDFNHTAASWNSYNFLGATTTNNMSYNSYGSTAYKFLPKVTFSYQNPSTCFKTSAITVSNLTTTGATLSWTPNVNGTETSWVLQYGTDATFAEGTYTPTTVNNDPTITLSDLTTESVYYARVKPDCDTEGLLWSNVCSFWPTATVPVVVNDGTTTNSYIPFYGYVGYGTPDKSQFIIPAANLENINPGSTLKRMTLHSTSYYSNVSWGDATFNVYLKEVTDDNFASATFVEDGLTTVYQGKLTLANSQMEIILDQDFTYNGGNLLVGFELTNNTGTSNYASWYGVNGSGNNSVYTYMGYSSQTGPSLSTFMPKVTFRLIQAEVTCEKPKNLTASNITSSEAIISWTSTESAWQLVYSTDANFDPDTATPIAVSGNPTDTLTGLSPLTDYYVCVRSNCTASNNGYSDWSSKLHFKTLAMAVAVGNGWSDDFEGESCGWELVNGTQTNKWVWGTAANNGGTHALYVSNDNGVTNAYTVNSEAMVYATKLLSFTEGKYEFSFDWRANGEGSGDYIYDFLRVALVPTSVTLTAGTSLPSGFTAFALPTGWIAVDGGSYLNGVNTWQSNSATINVTAGNYYLVMAWRDDTSSGSQPPAAVDNVSITKVACDFDVTNLAVSNITTSSATLSWEGGEATQWQVAYSTASNFEGATQEIVSTASYDMAGLQSSTRYYARVRAYCGGEDFGSWSDVFSFPTACGYAAVPFTENFDSYAGGTGTSNSLPLCWDYINTTSYSYYVGYPTIYNSSSYSHSGNNHLRFYSYYYPSSSTNYDPQPQYAILPGVENPSNMRVKLYARANSTSNNYDATFMVGVMEGNNFVGIDTIKPTTTTYQMYTIPLDRYTGTGTHIAIMIEAADATATSSNYHSVYIDDVTVEPLPDCATPTGFVLVANSQTPEGATIKWNNVEGASWIVEYKKAVDTEWTAISPAVTDTIYTFMGLEPSTGYQARVSVVCTGVTYPTDPVNFNTQMACPAPTNFTVRDLTDSSVTLAWKPGYNEDAWTVIYKKSSESTWPTEGTTVNDTLISLSNLDANTTYNVRISGCDATHYLTGNFTTKNPCAAPTNLVVSGVTNNSVTLSWTPGYQETEWTVLYWQEEATDTLRRVVNDSPTIRLTDLRAFTTYNVRVINCENALAGSFVTATVVPLIEAFANTSAPKGWNKYTGLLEYVLSDSIQLSSTTSGWYFGTYNGVFDNHARLNIYSTTCKYWMVTPTVLMENNVQLTFDLALTKYSGTLEPVVDSLQQDDKFVVLISTNGRSNWTVLRQWDNAGSEYVYNDIPCSATGRQVAIDLSSYAGQYVAIAFYGESTNPSNMQNTGGDNNLHVDNVSIDYIPSCEKPLGLAVADSTITATSAVATWEAGNATKWNLQYKRTTDTVWIPVNGLTEATYTFDTLVGGTSYEVQVQADCGDNGTSAWTDSKLFTTKLCSPEDMCEITFVLTDAWGDSWNNAYIEVIDVLTGITLGEVANENLNGTSGSGENEVNIKTLAVCDGREIQFVWHTGNYDNEASYVITSALGDEIINGSGGFSTPVNYIVNCTLDPCDAPNGLAAETTYNSAALSWNGAAENYYVRYREAGVNIENFTQVGADETTTADYVLYTYDLSSYNGQSGYIAIRHYNCTDQNLLLIDDVTLNNGTDNVFSYNFDNGVLPNGIEFYDMDGDGFNWDLDEIYQYDYDEWEYIYYAHSGTYCLYSASYDSDEGELTPDNWIILPYVEDLGCTLTFYARGFDSGYPDEVFGVFVTTEQNFVNEWINVPDIVSDTSYNLTGLNSLTTYEYQVQAADSECDDPQWSVSQEFTTLNGSVFITDGPWNVGSNWLNGSVPAEGADVIINANAVIPAEYTANVDEVTLSEGGSITIADGGQLFYGSDNLVVTMEKTISAYTDANGTGNYYLLAFPFRDNLEVPAAMTAAEGNDFYTFDNSAQGEEWQNNRQQASAIEEVTAYEGYLYANPSTIDLSFTGTTFGSPAAGYGYPNTYTYDADENEESGWLLLGNPLTCNAYIYGESDSGSFPMDVMYYDADGVMQTVSAGPVPPMQGFFVKITEDTKVWFMGAEFNAKSAPKPVNRGTMPVKMNLHKVVPVEK